MQVQIYKDEKHPYTMLDWETEGPYTRDVPVELANRLEDLRVQESVVLGQIDQHLRLTGQDPVT